MTIVLNSELREIAREKTIAELVNSLGVSSSVLVEWNGIALRQNEWADSALHDGDRIELIRIVAGG
jgi:thiamine biosynthesis protein ThiS